MIGDETPQAESTTLSNGGESDPSVPLNVEQDDSTEADRNHTTNIEKKPSKKSKLKKVTIQRTTAVLHNRMRRSCCTNTKCKIQNTEKNRSCCTLVADVATIEVGNGRWVDVSD